MKAIHPNDLLNSDLLSEFLLLGGLVALLASLLMILLASLHSVPI